MTEATAAARFGLSEALVAELAEGGVAFATVTAEALLMALVARARAARPMYGRKTGRTSAKLAARPGIMYPAAEAYLRGP